MFGVTYEVLVGGGGGGGEEGGGAMRCVSVKCV